MCNENHEKSENDSVLVQGKAPDVKGSFERQGPIFLTITTLLLFVFSLVAWMGWYKTFGPAQQLEVSTKLQNQRSAISALSTYGMPANLIKAKRTYEAATAGLALSLGAFAVLKEKAELHGFAFLFGFAILVTGIGILVYVRNKPKGKYYVLVSLLLLALVLVIMLGYIVVYNVNSIETLGAAQRVNYYVTLSMMMKLQRHLSFYAADNNTFPENLDELATEWPRIQLEDLWNNDFRYKPLGKHDEVFTKSGISYEYYELRSAGLDGEFNTSDDLLLLAFDYSGPPTIIQTLKSGDWLH